MQLLGDLGYRKKPAKFKNDPLCRCRALKFCSVECQKLMWIGHKPLCNKIKKTIEEVQAEAEKITKADNFLANNPAKSQNCRLSLRNIKVLPWS